MERATLKSKLLFVCLFVCCDIITLSPLHVFVANEASFPEPPHLAADLGAVVKVTFTVIHFTGFQISAMSNTVRYWNPVRFVSVGQFYFPPISLYSRIKGQK